MTRLTPDYDFKINDASLKSANVIEKITVALPVNSQASSFTAKLDNSSGTYNTYFAYHDDVKIYLGYVSEGTLGVFHGRVEKVKKSYTKSGAVVDISGRGTWAKLIEKFTVNSYTSTDLGVIIKAEVAALITGITTTNVADAGIAPAEEFLDHAFLNQMVSDYCAKAQYFAWVDFDDDLHFTGSPGANSVSITTGEAGNVETINMGIDWKTVRNYIRSYGKMVEEVQLLKTEQDDASIAKYGTVMKLIKNAGMDTASLVQSITDATLLEDKESEWGGVATVYGDERIVPGKTITVTVSEIGENTSYRVRHVNHSYDPKGAGFKTTVMLVQDEQDTSRFYKELYEKTKESTEFANTGNYEESYVYKFTKDQDALWTFSNCFTMDSSLKIGSTASAGTATLTAAIVGDKNYTKCLPFAREEYPGNDKNKYHASNDGGSTWEELDPYGAADDTAIEHTFASATGDKNDLKFRITVDTFDAIIHGAKTEEIIAYRPVNEIAFDYGTGITFKEYWRYNTPWGGDAYGVAFDKGKKIYMATYDEKIYTVDAVSGMNGTEEATLSVDIGGMYHDGTNLHLIDKTNNRISTRNATDLTVEDSNTSLPAGAGTELIGLGHDGTDFIVAATADGVQYLANAIWVKCTASQRFPEKGYFAALSCYAQTGAGYNSVNSKFYAVRDGTRFLMEFNVSMLTVDDVINMETVCGAVDYEPQSACDNNTTLWTTNTNGTTNRICKHNAADYGIIADATYDFAEATYGKFIGICFDGSDLWILSRKGTYGTWYKIDDSDGSLDATHTITGTESTGNLWADCEWDGSNLYATYTTKGTTNRDKVIYKFNSTPTTISAELQFGHAPAKKNDYEGTQCRGLAWDGSNFWITWLWPDSSSYGCWFRLANATEWGAITEAWYPFDCCSDGTYTWFIEDTSKSTKILRSTGEMVLELTTFEFARGMDYAPDITSSRVYTLGAYLKLDY